MNKGYITGIGFLMLLFGFLSILLGMVGLDLTFLKFLSFAGPLPKLIIELFMIFGGVVVMYLSRMEIDPEDLK